MRPGIKVLPWPSITRSPGCPGTLPTAVIRSASTLTSVPARTSLLPVKTRTFRNTVALIFAATQLDATGVRLAGSNRDSIRLRYRRMRIEPAHLEPGAPGWPQRVPFPPGYEWRRRYFRPLAWRWPALFQGGYPGG